MYNDHRINEGNEVLSGSGNVIRCGGVVLRPSGLWTPSVHALLRYLWESGYTGAPRVVGCGLDSEGRETLTFIEGQLVHPKAWTDEALVAVGTMLRKLHCCLASFTPPSESFWKPWFLRDVGAETLIYSHGDVAPWNTLTFNGMPIALIDWEYAGPIRPLTELARVCWLFAQLHDDTIAEMWGLPPALHRARQARLIVDAYGSSDAERLIILDRIIEVAVREAAAEADEMGVTPDSQGSLWGLAWKIRSASWMMQHRTLLEKAFA